MEIEDFEILTNNFQCCKLGFTVIADGRIVLQALILTSTVVCSSIAYTFWDATKVKDFSYLGPMLFTYLMVLILTGFIQMFFPLGTTSVAIYGGLSAMVLYAYIVYSCHLCSCHLCFLHFCSSTN